MWGMNLLATLLVCWVGSSYAQSTALCNAFGPRVECGQRGVTGATCQSLGCCWAADPLPKEDWQPDIYLPHCFYPNNGASSYTLGGTAAGAAQQTGNGTLTLKEGSQPELGPDLEELALSLERVAPAIARIKITNAEGDRYEVPSLLFPPDSFVGSKGQQNQPGAAAAADDPEGSPLFQVLTQQDPFGLVVARQNPATDAAGAATFNSTGLRLVFKPQYIELSTWVSPSAYLYGAGERASATTYMTRNGYPYTLWARDQGPSVPMRNSYSHWPFVMVVEQDGSSWGMLLHSSNGMDVVATRDQLSWRVIGGMIDLYVLLGPTPLAVMQQLARVVGRPAMPPYWAFGFHQGSEGYLGLGQVEQVVREYEAADLPLEAIWLDKHYMDGHRLFTTDDLSYPRQAVQRLVSDLAAKGQRVVPVLGPGVKVDPDYGPYLDGLQANAFLRGLDGQPYLGWTWPGGVHFPDFGFSPNADRYWSTQLTQFNQRVNFSGICTDMQEISNFCSGDICSLPTPQALVTQRGLPQTVCQALCYAAEASGLGAAGRELVDPPYQINNGLAAEPLNTKSVGVLARHGTGTFEYDAHSLYGLAMAQATATAVREIKQARPFVVARSTYTGSGVYAAHWTGDNNSTWADMRWSIPGVIAAGLAGIPMAGANICGSSGNVTTQLCSRWLELGAFYPLARSYPAQESDGKELYTRPAWSIVGRRVLGLRYSLLPHLYTLAKFASQTGAPILRPLFMNFPGDPLTFPISSQFMLGDALMVVPVLEEDKVQVAGYFPLGLWYDLWDNTTVDARTTSLNGTLYAPLGSPPTYLRGGAIIPQQRPALTTAAVKASPLTVTVALPELVFNVSQGEGGTAGPPVGETFTAAGFMFNDDGESLQANESCCNYLTFSATVTLSSQALTVNTDGSTPTPAAGPVAPSQPASTPLPAAGGTTPTANPQPGGGDGSGIATTPGGNPPAQTPTPMPDTGAAPADPPPGDEATTPNGTVPTVNPDGTVPDANPDGTIPIVNPDGTVTILNPGSTAPAPVSTSAVAAQGATPTPIPAPAPAGAALSRQVRRRSLQGFNETFNADTFFPNVTTGVNYSAVLELRFGRLQPGAPPDAAPACNPASAGGQPVAWPQFFDVRLLGWQLTGVPQDAVVEVDGNRTPIPPTQIFADSRQLIINLDSAQLTPQCGQVIRVLWSVSWPSPWVPWFPAEAIPAPAEAIPGNTPQPAAAK